jgi:hypothetical protein
MSEEDRLERVRQALAVLDARDRTRRELEQRAVRHEAIEVPLPLVNDLEEMRARIAEAKEDLVRLAAADPSGASARLAAEGRRRRAQVEVAHVRDLLRKRRANAAELARREAGHGPGEVPLELANRLSNEQEEVRALEARLRRAEEALAALEAEAPAAPMAGGEEASRRLLIATPDGAQYEAEVPPDMLLARVRSAFLADWHPPEDAGAVRYALRRDPDGQPLNPALTPAEAGLEDGATLYLCREPLTAGAPVGVTVEDSAGNRYVTRVRLDTPVATLGAAFMAMMQVSGEAVVEMARGAGAYRRLHREATLYDERVGEGARLRILPAA